MNVRLEEDQQETELILSGFLLNACSLYAVPVSCIACNSLFYKVSKDWVLDCVTRKLN